MLNQVAQKVLEERRGIHPEFVFTWRGKAAKKYGGGFRPGDAGKPSSASTTTRGSTRGLGQRRPTRRSSAGRRLEVSSTCGCTI